MIGLDTNMKTCSCCKLEKTLEEFNNRKRAKDGKRSECKTCQSKKSSIYYINNSNVILEKNKKWAEENKETRKQQNKKLYLKNKAHILNRHKNHYKTFTYIYRARDAQRRAIKLERTPKWLSTSQKEAIKTEYALAQWCSKVMGSKYHVDHIVPLAGKNVSGLHVPWNLQVIPASDNLVKGNRHYG
jgi:hypothetical protein